jgi:hypothetical protein
VLGLAWLGTARGSQIQFLTIDGGWWRAADALDGGVVSRRENQPQARNRFCEPTHCLARWGRVASSPTGFEPSSSWPGSGTPTSGGTEGRKCLCDAGSNLCTKIDGVQSFRENRPRREHRRGIPIPRSPEPRAGEAVIVGLLTRPNAGRRTDSDEALAGEWRVETSPRKRREVGASVESVQTYADRCSLSAD